MMKERPDVSVILPSLNVRPYIEECMESVLGQTLHDMEIICVDAGSTDGTWEILERYAAQEGRIVLLHSDVKSYGYQMNLGMSAAHGAYIGIVETDDVVPPEMFACLFEAADSGRLDFVKADFYRFKDDADGVRRKKRERVALRDENYGKVITPRACKQSFQFVMNTWSGIYRRSFLERYKIRHNESPGAAYQDNGFWFQTMMFADRAMFLDRAFYMNRRDNLNSSVFNRGNVFAEADEYRFIRNIIGQHPDYRKAVWPQFVRAMASAYDATLLRLPYAKRRTFLPRYAADFRNLVEAGKMPYEVFPDAQLGRICRIMLDEKRYAALYFEPMAALYRKMSAAGSVIIYGAGKMGKRLFAEIQRYAPDISVRCFAVTSMEGNEAVCSGVPVRTIAELDKYKETLIVVAMGRALRPPVFRMLKERGFGNVEGLPLPDDAEYQGENEIGG